MATINRYWSADAPKIEIDDQTLADALRLLLKDKRAAFQTAKDTGYAYPENPVGFRPKDFGIPELEKGLEYFEGIDEDNDERDEHGDRNNESQTAWNDANPPKIEGA